MGTEQRPRLRRICIVSYLFFPQVQCADDLLYAQLIMSTDEFVTIKEEERSIASLFNNLNVLVPILTNPAANG